MPQKKKKAGKKSAGPSEANEKKIEVLKRFYKGYVKRVEEAHDTEIEAVTHAYKSAVREGTPLVHLVLDGVKLHDTEASTSKLAILLTSICETGYNFLSELYIWNVRLEVDDVIALATYLRTRLDIRKLELLGCSIEPSAMDTFTEGLGFNRSINNLKLSFVNLGDEGLRLLALHMANNDILKQLTLHRCGITSASGAVLRCYLPAVALQELNLEGNQLGFKGLEDLAPAFPELEVLKEISLQENGIDVVDPGTMDENKASLSIACEYLKKPTGMKTLNLSFNNIGDDCGEIILACLTERKALGLTSLQVKVGHRMRSELFEAISAAGKPKATAKKKKKGGKKKKKK
eukprot:m.130353 g.130353  ORF g.130353 m.130353 type:complete len:347 (+) comp9468_c0_seq5:87-1127(+)